MWFAFCVGFGRPVVSVVSLALICSVWCWFWSFRGSGGFVGIGFWVAFGVGSGRCAEAGAEKSGGGKKVPALDTTAANAIAPFVLIIDTLRAGNYPSAIETRHGEPSNIAT